MVTQVIEDYDDELLSDPIKLCFAGTSHSEFGLIDAASSVSKAPTENEIETIDLTIPGIYEDCYHIRQLAVKIVDCVKFPWYYKKYIRSRSPTEEKEERDDYIVNSFDDSSQAKEDKNENQNVPTNMCLKIKYDSTIQLWKVQEGNANASPNTKDGVTAKSEPQRKLTKIDFKRNKGLIGFTITQKWVRDEEMIVFKEKKSISIPKIKVELEEDITQCELVNDHEKIRNVNNEKEIEVAIKEEPVEAESSKKKVIFSEADRKMEPSFPYCSLGTVIEKIVEKLTVDEPVNRINLKTVSSKKERLNVERLKEASQMDKEIKDLRSDAIQQNNLRPENLAGRDTPVKNVPSNNLAPKNAQHCHIVTLDDVPISDVRPIDMEQTCMRINDTRTNESIKNDIRGRNEALKHWPTNDMRPKHLPTKDGSIKNVPLKEIPIRNVTQKDIPLQDVSITNEPQKDETPKDVTMIDVSLKDVSSKGKLQRDKNKVQLEDVSVKDGFRDSLCKSIFPKDTSKNDVPLMDKPHKDMPVKNGPLRMVVVTRTVIPEKEENKLTAINNTLKSNRKTVIQHNYNAKSNLTKNNKKDLHYFSKPNSTPDITNEKIFKKKEQKSSVNQYSPNKTRKYTKKESKKGIESTTKNLSLTPEDTKVLNTKNKKELSMDIKQLREIKNFVEKVAKQLPENTLKNIEKTATKPYSTPNATDLPLRIKENNIKAAESINIGRSIEKINREGTYSNGYIKKSNINSYSSIQKNLGGNTTLPNLNVSNQPHGTEKLLQVSECSQQGKGSIPPANLSTQRATASSSAPSEPNTISTISSRPRIKYTSAKRACTPANQYAKQSAAIPPPMSYPPVPISAPCAQNNVHQYLAQLQPSDRLFHQHSQPRPIHTPHPIHTPQPIPHPHPNSTRLEQILQFNQPICHYNYGPHSDHYQPAVRDNVVPGGICGTNQSDVTRNYYYHYIHGSLVAPPPPPPPPLPPPPPPPSLPPQTPQIIENENYNQYLAIIHNGKKSVDPIRSVSAYSYAKSVNILTPQRKDNVKMSSGGDYRVASSGNVNGNVEIAPKPKIKSVIQKESSVVSGTKDTVGATKKEMKKLNEVIADSSNAMKRPSSDSLRNNSRPSPPAVHKLGENPAKKLKPDVLREEKRNDRKTNAAYSPPILPIPTYENILSIVKNRPPMSTSRIAAIRDDAAKCDKRKMFANDPRDCDKKISIDEYKKRICRSHNADLYHSSDRSNGHTKGFTGHGPKYAVKKFNDGNYNADQDLGYSSDTTVKL